MTLVGKDSSDEKAELTRSEWLDDFMDLSARERASERPSNDDCDRNSNGHEEQPSCEGILDCGPNLFGREAKTGTTESDVLNVDWLHGLQ